MSTKISDPEWIQYDFSKPIVISKYRQSGKSNYLNIDYSIWDEFLIPASHKDKLQSEYKRLDYEIKKMKDLEKLTTQRKMKLLKYQIKNHKKLFPEEYV